MDIFDNYHEDNDKIIDQETFEKVKQLQEITSEVKDLSLKEKAIKEDLKQTGKSKFIEKYQKDNQNPGTLTIEVEGDLGETARFTFSPSDKYKAIKSSKEADLIESNVGEKVVERELIHSFDPKLLEKYKETISNMIFNSEEIENEDKSKLIVAEEKYKIKPGLINEMVNYEDIQEVMDNVKPVISIKNPKVD